MDKIVSYLVGLGVPGALLLVLISISPYAGAAAIASTLASFGPGGMVLGVVSFMAVALLAQALTKYGFDAIFAEVKIGLKRSKGLSEKQFKAEMEAGLKKFWVSRALKNKIRRLCGMVTA